MRPRSFLPLLALLGAAALLPVPALSFDFGTNKVRYHTDHQWEVLETDHFLIHYYDPCQVLAQAAARDAEKAYGATCRALDFVPHTKIPLFIYSTPLEF